MGEKKMRRKERKSISKKKEKKAIVAAKPNPWYYYSSPYFSCPSLSGKTFHKRTWFLRGDGTGLGGITKSWISSSSACCIRQSWPQLVVINVNPENSRKNKTWQRESIPFRVSMSDGWMAVTGISSPAFAFFERDPKDYCCGGSWKLRDCRVTEPYSGDGNEFRYMEFTNFIGFERKYYAISRQGCLAIIEDEGRSGNFEITALGRNRAVPFCKESRHFREHLLEFNGEIYLVFLLSRVSINVVDGVEVFWLDSRSLSWEKVNRLNGGDAMFFVQDDRCIGISATSLGCSKGSNCVYFTHDRADDDSWFVYDMETSCISPTTGPEIDLPTPQRTR